MSSTRRPTGNASSSGAKKAKLDASAVAVAPPVANVKQGTDSEGKQYKNMDELWKQQFEDSAEAAAAGGGKKSVAWYQKGADYWMTQEASVDGVLGGFGHVSPVDMSGSKSFLSKLPGVRFDRTIDCGAGIGRISKGLLCPLFKVVDLVEQNPVYVAKAREYCAAGAHGDRMGQYWVRGLQDFEFEAAAYDVIWIQWVIGHLPDADFVPFMARCVKGLREKTGLIVLKENNAKKGFVMDLEDQSVTRTDAQYRALFEQAGLELIATELQKNFPAVLFPVRMYALRPKAAAAAAAAPAPAAVADQTVAASAAPAVSDAAAASQ